MKTTRFVFFALFGAAGFAFSQGSLTPPPGQPAPTMKTLQEIYDALELHVKIPTNGPLAVTTAGVYTLDKDWNFTTGGASAITISPGVQVAVIELNGHAITGAAGTLDGIHASPGTLVIVRGGSVRSFGGTGLFAPGCRVLASATEISSCLGDGLRVGPGSTLESVIARGNGGDGIECDDAADLRRIQCVGNGDLGLRGTVRVTVADAIIESNGGGGILLGDDAVLTRPIIRLNTGTGITAGNRLRCDDGECHGGNSDALAAGVGCKLGRCNISTAEAVSLGAGSVVSDGTLKSGGFLAGGALAVSATVFESNSVSLAGGAASFTNCRMSIGALVSGPNVSTAIRDCKITLTNNGVFQFGSHSRIECSECEEGNLTSSSSFVFGAGSLITNAKFKGIIINAGDDSRIECVECEEGNLSTGRKIEMGNKASIVKTTIRGFTLNAGDNASVLDTTVTNALGYGIDAGTNSLVRDCVVSGIGKELISGDPGDGIRVGARSAVRGCVVCLCDQDGIRLAGTACSAVGNNSNKNGQGQGVSDGAGIRATNENSLVDANLCAENDYGVAALTSHTTVTRNKVYDNSSNLYNPTGSPDVAPLALAATATNPFSNLY